MKSRLLPNGLSRRTSRCLLNAGIPIDREMIRHALKTGKLYPFFWPPNYGKYTHAEVCLWAGIDAETLSCRPSQDEVTPYPANGLSYRANRCLARFAIPATKRAVRHALRTGVLVPGQRPSNYGPQTHAELCRWAGVNPAAIMSARPKRMTSGPID